MTMTTAAAQPEVKAKRASIFDIDADRAALIDLLEECEESQTPDDSKVLAAWFDEVDGAFEDKVASYIVVARLQETLQKGLDEEAKRLSARAKVHKNRVERLKATLMYVFDGAGITRCETKRGTVSIAGNGGVAPLTLLVDDPKALPTRFQRVTVEADNEAIRAALAAGDPEAQACAVLATPGKHVRIK